jgi:hypothetical protein
VNENRALKEAAHIVKARRKVFDEWDGRMFPGFEQATEEWLKEQKIPYICFPPAEKRYSMSHIIYANHITTDAFIQRYGSEYGFLNTQNICLNIKEMWNRGINPSKIRKVVEWWK